MKKEHSIILGPKELPFDTLHEECGVFGIVQNGESGIIPAWDTYHALFALQHRGQESSGIAVNDTGVISCYKDKGIVPDIFTEQILDSLKGQMAIGHCRYCTSSERDRSNAQPLIARHVKGTMAIAANCSLVNAAELRGKIELDGGIFQTTTDAEVISYTIIRERLKSNSIEEAIKNAMHLIKGAYSLVIMSPRKMLAVRDPSGFRPLCIGKIGNAYVFASETCALDAMGAEFVRDVEPGEIVTCFDGKLKSEKCGVEAVSSTCVFEWIYFARPDSIIDGASVELARQEAGKHLAMEHPVGADVVIGVPDSGIPAAIGYSKYSGIPYGIGLIKNRYIARTFIQPTQQRRENAVKIKLNALAPAVKGKRVVLVDDSIVRGTTCARIIKLLRDAGATEVHMRVSSPPFLYPCYFGTDIPSPEHLIAHGRSVEEIRRIVGVDSLGFLSIDAAHKIAVGASCGFCDGCFTGKYPVEVPTVEVENKHEKRLGR